ncbi:hypothetical protein BaRGS_00027650 [Batillaria attramentaria]|uniref:ARF7 effector protein C-terminal domain-containing protein n=1 Tax=Batillaria attramentaria TaxID=370345 RepID=A0ABD0K2D5_9CAEN
MASDATDVQSAGEENSKDWLEQPKEEVEMDAEFTGGGESCSKTPPVTRMDFDDQDDSKSGFEYQTRQKGRSSSHLKKLSLDENGTFMSDFDPERSKREMRKLNRKIHKDTKKQNQMYDETGRLLENSLDVCDCLETDCPGCHFPCPKCGSEKCGVECRSGRRWTYEQVEVEGTNQVFKWSAT